MIHLKFEKTVFSGKITWNGACSGGIQMEFFFALTSNTSENLHLAVIIFYVTCMLSLGKTSN